MKTTGVSLALLVLLAAAALAQVPRTINYQGRVQVSGQPVNGTHQMTLALYTTETGASTVFTDGPQTVAFTSGVFTAAIGAGTTGGIPESVPFDREYWLGVTISGVNGGQELPNRFRLRSTPYSLRAEHANFAAVADEANSLVFPGTIAGAVDDGPALDVSNSGNSSIGLQATGSDYGVVSNGPVKTTDHYIAEEIAGDKNAPESGALYYDNAPIAWAQIAGDGTVIASFGVARVVAPGSNNPGEYEIVLHNDLELTPPSKPTIPAFAPVITPGTTTTDSPIIIPTWLFKRDTSGYSTNTIIAYLRDVQGQAVNFGFSIVVFGRPQ